MDITPNHYDYEAITVNTATGFTAAKLAPQGLAGRMVEWAMLTVETDQIRYRIDGGVPSSSVGHLMNVGDPLVLVGVVAIQNFQAIKVTNNATIQVTYGWR